MSLHTSEDTFYRVAFSHIDGVGPLTFKKLLSICSSPKKAFFAPLSRISHCFPTTNARENFTEFRTSGMAERVNRLLIKKSIQVINPSLPEYSKSFSSLSDIPIILYAKGNIQLLTSSALKIAIVGTRKPNQYGITNTKKFADIATLAGGIIVSGMALGIDAHAHTYACAHNGKTIAVLGSGFDHVHPKSNLGLYNKILSSNGLVLTEFPPHVTARPGNFPVRNRLIAALSDGVIVVQGTYKSGSLLTGAEAAEQNKDVFAVPGSIDSPLSEAPHKLIEQGAHILYSIDYLNQFYNLPPKNMTTFMSHPYIPYIKEGMTAHLISQELHQPIHTVLAELTSLELHGAIKKNSDNTFSLQFEYS